MEVVLAGDLNQNAYGTSMQMETIVVTSSPGTSGQQRHFEIPHE